MGAGASMVWSTGFPILVPLYPLWAGRITSLVEAFVGLGSMIGPSLGSALYSIGGYATPFIAAGVAEMVLAMMAVAFLPTGRKSGFLIYIPKIKLTKIKPSRNLLEGFYYQ